MLGYTDSLTMYQDLTNNDETSNTRLFGYRYNNRLRQVYGRHNWKFLEEQGTTSTVASTQFYDMPYNFKKLINVTQTNGDTVYSPKKCPDRATWDLLNSSSTTSDIPEWYFVWENQLGLYPKSSSAGNTITYNYKKRTKDIDTADYTTGDVTVTNGSTTVTGNGTTFTAGMVGRWFKADGDGEWYKIAGFTSTTVITLKDSYEGTTGAGASYTIAEVCELPEDFQDIPVILAVSDYYRKEKDLKTAREFMNDAQEQIVAMKRRYYGATEDVAVIDNEIPINNPNLFVEL